jgi:hypothetical protein
VASPETFGYDLVYPSRGSSVIIAGLPRFDSRQGLGTDFLSSLLRPDRLWGPPSLLYSGYRLLFPWGVKLTTYLHVVPRLRMRGAIPPLPQYVFIAYVSTGITHFSCLHWYLPTACVLPSSCLIQIQMLLTTLCNLTSGPLCAFSTNYSDFTFLLLRRTVEDLSVTCRSILRVSRTATADWFN